jgi:hypothetical protein
MVQQDHWANLIRQQAKLGNANRAAVQENARGKLYIPLERARASGIDVSGIAVLGAPGVRGDFAVCPSGPGRGDFAGIGDLCTVTHGLRSPW